MYLLISVLIIIASILLILIVLVQNSKGGGLASNFASSNQVMGVRKTADFLEKATWTLAVSLLVLSLFASFAIPRDRGEVSRSAIEEQLDRTPSQSTLPTFPTPTPDEDGNGGDPDEN
ncbi:preprotein translocase subunit SecG [Perlabentimonas gracilis]|uniref:preprotein translocase subunit SecG n=1 Tax=Perlabentimonas gracilis TaxID=2715279 RepID=UPI0014073546|nr:preprotein translocase subunit SecG [Perlabentimonas gracilis]NHB70023.1 preprotein translocase subunit SecG [Perlabentimonas gracilis]